MEREGFGNAEKEGVPVPSGRISRADRNNLFQRVPPNTPTRQAGPSHHNVVGTPYITPEKEGLSSPS